MHSFIATVVRLDKLYTMLAKISFDLMRNCNAQFIICHFSVQICYIMLSLQYYSAELNDFCSKMKLIRLEATVYRESKYKTVPLFFSLKSDWKVGV